MQLRSRNRRSRATKEYSLRSCPHQISGTKPLNTIPASSIRLIRDPRSPSASGLVIRVRWLSVKQTRTAPGTSTPR